MRAIAIVWVISLHLPGQLPPLGNPITRRGHLGVEIFFAISGFLVTRSLHQCIVRAERSAGNTAAVARDFLTRRIGRIWPPYFVALLVAIGAMLIDPVLQRHLGVLRGMLWTYPAFLANYAIPYYDVPLSLLVLWSLCFEEQFYAFLVVGYLLVRERLARFLIISALLSLGARIAFAAFDPAVFQRSAMQMQLHWRFDALAWGCLAWLFHAPLERFLLRTRRRGAVEAAALLAALAVCIPLPKQPLTDALLYLAMAPCFAAVMVVVAFSPASATARLLAWPPLVFVGVISYEIYLSHITVYRLLSRLHLDGSHAVYYPLCVAVSLMVAAVFHHFFSKPAQRWISSRLTRTLVARPLELG
jgi:peptidoglycan/LPS O-acetylase OafA/YrhL